MSRHAPSESPWTRVVRNGLLVTATATAVVAAAFAVAPSGSAAGAPAASVADSVTGAAAESALRSQPGSQRASRADAARQAAQARRAARAAAAAAATSAPASSSPAAATPDTAEAPAAAPVADPAPAGGPAPSTGDRMYIGSVAGGYEQAVAATGVPLANHAYAFFSGNVPQAAMITVSAASTRWRDVAAAGPGLGAVRPDRPVGADDQGPRRRPSWSPTTTSPRRTTA